MLEILDGSLFFFHTLLILFNMVGWAFKRTRVLHLISFGLTVISWLGLGAMYGWGYCICTDWHFQIRDQLGYNDPQTNSYIVLIGEVFFGQRWSEPLTNWIAAIVFMLIFIATATVWTRMLMKRIRT